MFRKCGRGPNFSWKPRNRATCRRCEYCTSYSVCPGSLTGAENPASMPNSTRIARPPGFRTRQSSATKRTGPRLKMKSSGISASSESVARWIQSSASWCNGEEPLPVSTSRLVSFTGVMSARFSLSTTRSTLASRRGSCSALAWRPAATHPPSCPMASWVFRNGRVMSTKT